MRPYLCAAYAALLLIAGTVGNAIAGDRTETARVSSAGTRAVVYGCSAEDSCRIDYRADNAGRPVWVIRRVSP
jgi:hypothetical protein